MMIAPQSRREFLANVGKGGLLATLGPALAEVTPREFGHLRAGQAEARKLLEVASA